MMCNHRGNIIAASRDVVLIALPVPMLTEYVFQKIVISTKRRTVDTVVATHEHPDVLFDRTDLKKGQLVFREFLRCDDSVKAISFCALVVPKVVGGIVLAGCNDPPISSEVIFKSAEHGSNKVLCMERVFTRTFPIASPTRVFEGVDGWRLFWLATAVYHLEREVAEATFIKIKPYSAIVIVGSGFDDYGLSNI